MKKITLITTAIFLSASMTAQVDPHWNTTGNGGVDPDDDFIGTLDNADLRFHTNDGFKMTLTSPAGWLGLNTTTPEMMFHVFNGGILSTGTSGTNPDLEGGTRLMWIPDQFAFRAGVVDDDQWDGANVGNGSVAFGQNNIASGTRSVAFGIGNEVAGDNSLTFGSANAIADTAPNAFAVGVSNTINETGGVALGLRNTINYENGVTIGSFLHANAENAMVLGRGYPPSESPLRDSDDRSKTLRSFLLLTLHKPDLRFLNPEFLQWIE